MEDWAIFWISIGNTSLYIIKDKWLKGVFSIQRFSWYQGCFSNNLHFSSKRSSLTNVTWLLLLSIAKVFTSLMCFSYFTVTGTTYILAMLFFLFWLIEALLKSSISVHLFDEFLLFSHHHFFLVHYFAFYTDNHGEQLDIGSYILYIWSFLCILWPCLSAGAFWDCKPIFSICPSYFQEVWLVSCTVYLDNLEHSK